MKNPDYHYGVTATVASRRTLFWVASNETLVVAITAPAFSVTFMDFCPGIILKFCDLVPLGINSFELFEIKPTMYPAPVAGPVNEMLTAHACICRTEAGATRLLSSRPVAKRSRTSAGYWPSTVWPLS